MSRTCVCMKLHTSTFKTPAKESEFSFCLKMPSMAENCLLNSSSPQMVAENGDKNMSGVTAEFIEDFSELNLEEAGNKKSACEKSGQLGKVVNRIEAKISIEEKNREIVCLSCSSEDCCKKSQLIRKEEKKINLPLSDALIDRSPDRIGRRHCREGLSNYPTSRCGKSNTQSESYVDNFSLYSPFPVSDVTSQFLHCNGGSVSEASISEDQFSPCSISSISSSSAYSSSPSSYSYMSPSGVVHNESEDSGHDSPSTEELYSSPPNSACGTITPLFDDIPYNADSNQCLRDFEAAQSAGDDSLSQFLFSEDSSLANVSPTEKICDSNVSSHSTVPEERLEHIIRYLKDGKVDPITSQLVKHFSESLAKSASSPSLAHANNHQEIKKNDNKHIDVFTTQLPSAVPCPSFGRSETGTTQQTILLQLQAVALMTPKEKHQRQIKPSIAPAQTKKVDKERCQSTKEPTKTNSTSPGGGFKSVKAKISASMTRDEKNRLLRSEVEEKKLLESGETSLHLAALKGDEKLAYVLVESKRTQIKSENSKTDNPRIYMKNKIQAFVNVQNKQGLTPLYCAVFAGNDLLTAYLLECGADPFIQDYEYGNTPYHIATMRGDGAVVLIELLSYCKDISNVRNNKGQTILMAAVRNHGEHCRGIKVIKHLLSTSHMLTPQDCDGRTALHIAVMQKDVELVELLLAYAIDANKAILIQDNNGNTILHVAAKLSNIQTDIHIKLLHTITMHCPNLTEVRNKEGKLPYELIKENRIQERNLLRNKMDEFGFRNL